MLQSWSTAVCAIISGNMQYFTIQRASKQWHLVILICKDIFKMICSHEYELMKINHLPESNIFEIAPSFPLGNYAYILSLISFVLRFLVKRFQQEEAWKSWRESTILTCWWIPMSHVLFRKFQESFLNENSHFNYDIKYIQILNWHNVCTLMLQGWSLSEGNEELI